MPPPLRKAQSSDVAQALAQALQFHHQGRLPEAERLYAEILRIRPDHFDALQMMGLVKLAKGEPAEALRLVSAAMRGRKPSPQILLNHGLILNALERPYDTATSMIAGTTANTVIWYTGEAGGDPARSTATARIDQSLVVSYGARANEDAIRALVQNFATLAAVTISPSDPNAADLSAALNRRLAANLAAPPGTQTLTDIETELANAQTSMSAAKSRHQQTTATLSDFLQQLEGVSNEGVGARILALQTRMQASMQTTALLFQTSLVNYL